MKNWVWSLEREYKRRYDARDLLQLEELGLVAGTASFPLDRCRAAVEMVDLQHRRGSYGLPLQRHTLMIDPLWKEGDSLPEKVDA